MKLTLSVLTVVIFGFGAGIAGAVDPMADKEAKPTIGERLTKDTVKGMLMRMDGEYYWVKDTDGKEIRLHVDASTKLDKVVKGDRVKAFITDKGIPPRFSAMSDHLVPHPGTWEEHKVYRGR